MVLIAFLGKQQNVKQSFDVYLTEDQKRLEDGIVVPQDTLYVRMTCQAMAAKFLRQDLLFFERTVHPWQH